MAALPHEFLATSMSGGQHLIATATGVLGAGLTVAKAIQIVGGNEMGVRTHNKSPYVKRDREEIKFLGKVLRQARNEGDYWGIVGPGVYPVFPLLHPIVTVNVKDRQKHLEAVEVQSAEGEIYHVKTGAIWRVRSDGDNPLRALYNVNRGDKDKDDHAIEGMFELICASGVRQVAKGLSSETLRNLSGLPDGVHDVTKDRFSHYGIELESIEVLGSVPIPAERQRQGIQDGIREGLGGILLSQMERPGFHVA